MYYASQITLWTCCGRTLLVGLEWNTTVCRAVLRKVSSCFVCGASIVFFPRLLPTNNSGVSIWQPAVVLRNKYKPNVTTTSYTSITKHLFSFFFQCDGT